MISTLLEAWQYPEGRPLVVAMIVLALFVWVVSGYYVGRAIESTVHFFSRRRALRRHYRRYVSTRGERAEEGRRWWLSRPDTSEIPVTNEPIPAQEEQFA